MAWSTCGLNTGACYPFMVQIRKLRPREAALAHTVAIGRTQVGIQVHLVLLGISLNSQSTKA